MAEYTYSEDLAALVAALGWALALYLFGFIVGRSML